MQNEGLTTTAAARDPEHPELGTAVAVPDPVAVRGPASAGLADIVPVVDVVYVAGPPIAFIAVPWLLFGLMLAAPFAVVLALTAVFVLAALAAAALVALVAAPFLLMRRMRLRDRPARSARTRASAPAVTLSAARLWPAGV